MISDYAKRQGQEYQKLSQNRQWARFGNTPPLAAGVLYFSSPVTPHDTIILVRATFLDTPPKEGPLLRAAQSVRKRPKGGDFASAVYTNRRIPSSHFQRHIHKICSLQTIQILAIRITVAIPH